MSVNKEQVDIPKSTFLTSRDPGKYVRVITLAAITFTICWGLVFVLAQVRPFWIDEWRIIYNLKYKSPAAIFGPLDFVQQFPRVYLEIIKAFSSRFDYSYFSLRFPSFLAGTLAIILACRLMSRIFRPGVAYRFLFVLFIISAPAFTEYYLQMKQYTMDVLLSLLAIWQLIELSKDKISAPRYVLLCLSFLIAPFFSYTYPIVVAPLFIIYFSQNIHTLSLRSSVAVKVRSLLKQGFPLLVCAAGILVFYIVDVAQLMADKSMHQYWAPHMMNDGFNSIKFARNSFQLFAQLGGGLFFEIVFGMAGLTAFTFAITRVFKKGNRAPKNVYELTQLYSVLLLLLVFTLFLAGKIPLGDARLNLFTVPAIGIILISFIEFLKEKNPGFKWANMVPLILLVGVCGNIFTASLNQVIDRKYDRKYNTYVNTENAIILAQSRKIPMLITSEVAYPYNKVISFPSDSLLGASLCIPPKYHQRIYSPLKDNIPGDWILKTFPAYKIAENIKVYAINNLDNIKDYFRQLPPYVNSVVAGDGITFRVVNRNDR